MVRIMLVEDQAIVRQGLKMMIEQYESYTVIAEASTGVEALQQMEIKTIDCIVMDIRMPDLNGIEATRKIKCRLPNVKILILTTFNDDEYAMEALKVGANGFMLKTANANEVIEAIDSCLKGGMRIHEEVAAKVVPKLLKSENKSSKCDIPLSPRELSITKCVGEGKTNKEIAVELHLSVGTVKNHVTQILHKLELRDRTQLAIYAIRNDLV
ncbi:response regulator transcription factor [Bacillus sp. FJAT-47783]|uniref:response regulator transcription factor n=1 Tax=Bacillus sp. FJAT-47783 TaxID=2922712 RepID=UPI001FAE4F1A|nr:response regulator transcription factor [Bacillus sp. FJAT-47783]